MTLSDSVYSKSVENVAIIRGYLLSKADAHDWYELNVCVAQLKDALKANFKDRESELLADINNLQCTIQDKISEIEKLEKKVYRLECQVEAAKRDGAFQSSPRGLIWKRNRS